MDWQIIWHTLVPDLRRPPVVPGTVATPLRSVMGGQAESWDGRLFVLHRTAQSPERGVWDFVLLRPEAVIRDPSTGLPIFDSSTVSHPMRLEISSGSNTMALVPTPGFDVNPFRCNATGITESDGTFECYALTIYTHTSGDRFENHVGRFRARVIVAEPRTPRAAPVAVIEESSFGEIRTVTETRSWESNRPSHPTVAY